MVSAIWPPPSLLARKILCTAYVGAPFNSQTAWKLQTLHSAAALRVIARHLKEGYKLDSIEKRGTGFRIDLVFVKPMIGSRIVEVKTARKLQEVHKLQASLYSNDRYNEIVVSNRNEDVVLTPEFICNARERAHRTREMLAKNPEKAAVNYTPHPDVCRTCANESCPFLGLSKQNEADSLPFFGFHDSDP
ncbi:MAG TPA: hypothetical protein VJZ32_03160 [Candidatus Bathyarchaeia archaeon]|nr:hypothetical protein [Candidatus Bathyarchaeia archaeon]